VDAARRRILETADALFRRHGFSGVRMDEIASELGMSKKTLYQHFPGKEELLAEVLEGAFQKVRAELDALLDAPGVPFEERLRRYVTFVAGQYAALPGPVLRDLQRNAPTAWARFSTLQREAIETRFSRLIAAGIAAGELRADLDPRLMVRVVLTLAQQLLQEDTLRELELAPVDAIRAIFSVALDGLRPREAPRPSSRTGRRR